MDLLMSESAFVLRDIDAEDVAAIDLIAHRMRATLVEVEGEETGTGMYSIDWLRDRVRQHLDASRLQAKVVIAEDRSGTAVGHTIFRTEADASGERFGLISTTYVVPEVRRFGIASQLLARAETWFNELALPRGSTWTSARNAPLIGLYERHGYARVENAPNDLTGTPMTRLERRYR